MITRRRMLAAPAASRADAPDRRRMTATSTRRTGTMEIKRSGSQPSGKGPAEYFTGTVRIDPLFEAPEPARGAARASPSSRARAPPGTRIRSARR